MSDAAPKFRWTERSFDEADLVIPIAVDVDVVRKDIDADGNYVAPGQGVQPPRLQYLVQNPSPVFIRALRGPGASRANWQDSLGAFKTFEYGADQSIELCGQPATRVEVRIRGKDMEVHTRRGPTRRRAEDLTAVLVLTERGGQPVVVEWRIASDQRDAYRPAEAEFFAKLGCK